MPLECHTAKFKLSESEYFLKTLQKQNVWNDDTIFDFFLNSFVVSSVMVIDYVHSDFIFHSVKPRINWIHWRKIRNDDEELDEFINKHPKKLGIKKFLKYFEQKKANLMQKPIVNYFVIKRHVITHVGWRGHKFSSFTEFPDGRIQVHKRTLENHGSLGLREIKKKRLTQKQLDEKFPLDMFNQQVPKTIKEKALKRIAEEPLQKICKEHLKELKSFIDKFEGQEFLK